MNTNSLSKSYKLELTLQDILNLIKGFRIEDKVLIEEQIEKETLKYRAKKLSKRIKPNNITMDEIVFEVKAVRKCK